MSIVPLISVRVLDLVRRPGMSSRVPQKVPLAAAAPAMEDQVWGKIIIIGKDGKERKAEMELDDLEGDPYIFGRCALHTPLGTAARC